MIVDRIAVMRQTRLSSMAEAEHCHNLAMTTFESSGVRFLFGELVLS